MDGIPPAPGAVPLALAVDIGGTKLAVGLVDPGGRLLWSAQGPTPPAGSAAEVWGALEDLLQRAPDDGRPGLCGVGCGGPMTGRGDAVSPLNIPGWRDFPLRSRLVECTGLPTSVDNDAKALALAEGWCGAAVGVADYISLVVSTGVGGGLVVDGRLLDGEDGNAGHVGHVIVEPDGHLCGCGAIGCLEAEASGTAIARITGAAPADAPPAVRARTGMLVGRGVASVANLLDLALATVAGSVALGFGDTFFQAAQAEIDARCRLDHSRGCRIVPSGLAAEGPLVGAAAVGYRAAGLLVSVR
ncbi:MAG: ROK family protein [Acidimicrobiales bacterium]